MHKPKRARLRDQRGRFISAPTIPPQPPTAQAEHLARKYRLKPHMVATISALAFHGSAR